MSLPNYLSSIKSSGVYRFVWDKSEVPPQTAETLRLVVGYSDKGPFNTPVYIDKASDFITIFGNVSKRLEKKGVYFHRLALQALSAGPILALNLKKFDEETVGCAAFDMNSITNEDNEIEVSSLYDTRRFWALDVDMLPEKIEENKYCYLTATDVKDNSCTVYIRKTVPASYEGLTLRSWYATQNLEIPAYLENVLDTYLDQYFAEVYVFRGQVSGDIPALAAYFDAVKNDQGTIEGYKLKADSLEKMAQDSQSNFIGSYTGCTIPYFKDANGYYISLDIKFNADSVKHKMLMKLDEEYLTTENCTSMQLTEDTISELYLPGYTFNTPANPWEASKEVLSSGGLYEALTNRVDVEYHYIVDTFDGDVKDNEVEAKTVLFQIAKAKDNAFVIANFPKMSKLWDKATSPTSPNPSIKDAVANFKQSMPNEVDGASWGAYYTQLTFSDGTVKSVVPSAALVSNLFMNKWGARQPYYIVAGPTHGRLSYAGLIGPDFNFGRSDLDVLEPMGVNAIVYVPRKGTYINSNQTAKQIPVSGLSKIHIRELVIYLQNEIENLLQSYQWELNTQALRDTIRSKADAICDTIMNNGGIYAYINICDETNNTPEVVDNEMIILDTEIEPARGAGKMVHQLTIHKTGALSSVIK